MVEYSWQLLRCPKCNMAYRWHINKLFNKIRITSGLGASKIECSRCGEVFDSGLLEWQEMSVTKRIWYLILSVFYGVMLGFFFSLGIFAVIGFVGHITDPHYPSMKLTIPVILIFAFLVLYGQLLRIELSNRRIESSFQQPMKVSFWAWQTNLQFYGWIFMCVSLLLLIIFT